MHALGFGRLQWVDAIRFLQSVAHKRALEVFSLDGLLRGGAARLRLGWIDRIERNECGARSEETSSIAKAQSHAITDR